MNDLHRPTRAVMSAPEQMRFASLQTRAALAGWALTKANAGFNVHFLASRWGRSRELRDLEAVHDFLQRVEGGRG